MSGLMRCSLSSESAGGQGLGRKASACARRTGPAQLGGPSRRSCSTGMARPCPTGRPTPPVLRARVEALCAAGVHVFVVSGTHVGNIDGQLRARPAGPGRLHLCLNRGSEVFEVGSGGPELRWRRTASPDEEAALDRTAGLVVEQLGARGMAARVVSKRLNRRKIDLIPEPAWADPPKARIGELLDAVAARLRAAGIAGLSEVVAVAMSAAQGSGLADPRITSDGKHVEIGLTDKSDSARWAARWLAERGDHRPADPGGRRRVRPDRWSPRQRLPPPGT